MQDTSNPLAGYYDQQPTLTVNRPTSNWGGKWEKMLEVDRHTSKTESQSKSYFGILKVEGKDAHQRTHYAKNLSQISK